MTRRVRVIGSHDVPEGRALELFEALLERDSSAQPTEWSTGPSTTGVDSVVREHLRASRGEVSVSRSPGPLAPPPDELWAIWDGATGGVLDEILAAAKAGARITIECWSRGRT